MFILLHFTNLRAIEIFKKKSFFKLSLIQINGITLKKNIFTHTII